MSHFHWGGKGPGRRAAGLQGNQLVPKGSEKNPLLRKFLLVQSYPTLCLAQPRATSSFSSRWLFKDSLSLLGKGEKETSKRILALEELAIPFYLEKCSNHYG